MENKVKCIVCGKLLKQISRGHIRTEKHLKVTNDLYDKRYDLEDLIKKEDDELIKKELTDKLNKVEKLYKLYMDFNTQY